MQAPFHSGNSYRVDNSIQRIKKGTYTSGTDNLHAEQRCVPEVYVPYRWVMTWQERFVIVFLIVGALCGFSYAYYKEFFPPIDIKFKKPFGQDAPEAKKLEEIIEKAKAVNINSATIEDFMLLRGIGPSLAKRIVTYREENGPFVTIEVLKNVRGIGPKKFDNIKEFLVIE